MPSSSLISLMLENLKASEFIGSINGSPVGLEQLVIINAKEINK
jgi:hypothetical protein